MHPLDRPPEPAPSASRPRYFLAGLLFALTFFTTTTVGAVLYLATRTDETTDLLMMLTPRTVLEVWSDPALVATGLRLSVPVLFILLCHELGHYFACRLYRLPATLPYFLPAPFGLGTLGAFIRIRSPIRRKAELLDVGAAGPLAGFAALLPFLLLGVAWSVPVRLERVLSPQGTEPILLLPGKSLAMEMASRLFHGPLGADQILDLHPFALAAWVGLLATALNLLPLGQLDGGHVLYALIGRRHPRLAPVLWMLLPVAGFFFWRGWLVWFVLIFVMGLRHPPVYDEATPLDPGRKLVAAACLLLLVLCFMPVPISAVVVAP